MTDKQFVKACSKMNMPGLDKSYLADNSGTEMLEKRKLSFYGDWLISSNGATRWFHAREAAAILRDFMLRQLAANAETCENLTWEWQRLIGDNSYLLRIYILFLNECGNNPEKARNGRAKQ